MLQQQQQQQQHEGGRYMDMFLSFMGGRCKAFTLISGSSKASALRGELTMLVRLGWPEQQKSMLLVLCGEVCH
jgi:hypothetical protein